MRRQHHGQAPGAFRTYEITQITEWFVQHLINKNTKAFNARF